MKSRKAIIIGFGIGVSLLVWIGVLILVRQVQPEGEPNPKPVVPLPSPTPPPALPKASPTPAKREAFILGGGPSQTGPRPNTSPPHYPDTAWTEYKEDEFYDVIWRWRYNLPDKTPRDIRPFCPECSYQNEMGRRLICPERSMYPPYEQRPVYLRLWCDSHPQIYEAEHIPNMRLDDFSKIKALIQGKLEDGSWEEVVAKKRHARSMGG